VPPGGEQSSAGNSASDGQPPWAGGARGRGSGVGAVAQPGAEQPALGTEGGERASGPGVAGRQEAAAELCGGHGERQLDGDAARTGKVCEPMPDASSILPPDDAVAGAAASSGGCGGLAWASGQQQQQQQQHDGLPQCSSDLLGGLTASVYGLPPSHVDMQFEVLYGITRLSQAPPSSPRGGTRLPQDLLEVQLEVRECACACVLRHQVLQTCMFQALCGTPRQGRIERWKGMAGLGDAKLCCDSSKARCTCVCACVHACVKVCGCVGGCACALA